MHWVLDPHSPQARAVSHLWWWMVAVGGATWLAVMAWTVAAALRRPRSEPDPAAGIEPAAHSGVERAVIAAVVVTTLVLIGFTVFDFSVGRALAMHPSRTLTIDVVGHQWWWEVQYENPSPSHAIVTANELHVPVGEMVQIKLRAADVIHSFWLPSLNGKEDLIPGYLNTLWFKADTAGTYIGQCAEFCGLQHAKMRLRLVAEPRPDFDRWFADQQRAGVPPSDADVREGQRLFLSGPCATCHAIGGTDAGGTVGPDLTHVASRATLAAGALPNTFPNLEAWIIDAPAIKPGVNMPAMTTYTAADLRRIASYLWTLK